MNGTPCDRRGLNRLRPSPERTTRKRCTWRNILHCAFLSPTCRLEHLVCSRPPPCPASRCAAEDSDDDIFAVSTAEKDSAVAAQRSKATYAVCFKGAGGYDITGDTITGAQLKLTNDSLFQAVFGNITLGARSWDWRHCGSYASGRLEFLTVVLSEQSRHQFFGAHVHRELRDTKYEIAAPAKGKKGTPRSVSVVVCPVDGFAAAGVASDAIFDTRYGVGTEAPGVKATLWIRTIRGVDIGDSAELKTSAGYAVNWMKSEIQPQLRAKIVDLEAIGATGTMGPDTIRVKMWLIDPKLSGSQLANPDAYVGHLLPYCAPFPARVDNGTNIIFTGGYTGGCRGATAPTPTLEYVQKTGAGGDLVALRWAIGDATTALVAHDGTKAIRIGGVDEAAGFAKAASAKTARRAGERAQQRHRRADPDTLLQVSAAFTRRGIPTAAQCATLNETLAQPVERGGRGASETVHAILDATPPEWLQKAVCRRCDKAACRMLRGMAEGMVEAAVAAHTERAVNAATTMHGGTGGWATVSRGNGKALQKPPKQPASPPKAPPVAARTPTPSPRAERAEERSAKRERVVAVAGGGGGGGVLPAAAAFGGVTALGGDAASRTAKASRVAKGLTLRSRATTGASPGLRGIELDDDDVAAATMDAETPVLLRGWNTDAANEAGAEPAVTAAMAKARMLVIAHLGQAAPGSAGVDAKGLAMVSDTDFKEAMAGNDHGPVFDTDAAEALIEELSIQGVVSSVKEGTREMHTFLVPPSTPSAQ